MMERLMILKMWKMFEHRAGSQVLTNDKQQYSLLHLLMVLIAFDLQSSLREEVFESLQKRKSFTTNAWELCFKRKVGAMRTSWRSRSRFQKWNFWPLTDIRWLYGITPIELRVFPDLTGGLSFPVRVVLGLLS